MPPKKTAAPKGAKGKAKAQDKEEKKQAKVAKSQPKGKYTGPFYHSHSLITNSIVSIEILSIHKVEH